MDITDRCLQAAIDICKPGTPVRKIGATIHAIAVGLYKPNPVVTHSARQAPGFNLSLVGGGGAVTSASMK